MSKYRMSRVLGVLGAVLAGTVALWPAVAAADPSPAAPSTPTPSAAAPSAAAQPGTLTVSYDVDCRNYGADVTNHDTIAHTVTVIFDGTASAPVEIPPGETRHLAFDTQGPSQVSVQIVDSVDGIIADTVIRNCIVTANKSVTIKANSTYAFNDVAPGPGDPKPQHGTLTLGAGSLEYTPDPCFSGTDRFGYEDGIALEKGLITVHVLPGPCGLKIRRSATDCGQRSVTYTAGNPYSVPARIDVEAKDGVRTRTVTAHTTKVVGQTRLDPTGPQTETVTFRVAGTGRTLLTDTVHFPCPLPVSHEGQSPATGSPGLAATGSSVAEPAAFGGAGLVVLGAGLLLAGRYRRTDG